ncbi:lonely Cys domain-containing protein, partial [Streptomyces sp. NPDC002523]
MDTAVPHAKVFAFFGMEDPGFFPERWTRHNPDATDAAIYHVLRDPETGRLRIPGKKRQQWRGPTAYVEFHADPESFEAATYEHGKVRVPPETITNLLERMPEFTDFVDFYRAQGIEPNIVIIGCEAGRQTFAATLAAQAVADALNSTKTYASAYKVGLSPTGHVSIITDTPDVPDFPFAQFSAAPPGRKQVSVGSPLFSGAISLDGPGNSRMRFPFVPDEMLEGLIGDRTPGGRPFIVHAKGFGPHVRIYDPATDNYGEDIDEKQLARWIRETPDVYGQLYVEGQSVLLLWDNAGMGDVAEVAPEGADNAGEVLEWTPSMAERLVPELNAPVFGPWGRVHQGRHNARMQPVIAVDFPGDVVRTRDIDWRPWKVFLPAGDGWVAPQPSPVPPTGSNTESTTAQATGLRPEGIAPPTSQSQDSAPAFTPPQGPPPLDPRSAELLQSRNVRLDENAAPPTTGFIPLPGQRSAHPQYHPWFGHAPKVQIDFTTIQANPDSTVAPQYRYDDSLLFFDLNTDNPNILNQLFAKGLPASNKGPRPDLETYLLGSSTTGYIATTRSDSIRNVRQGLGVRLLIDVLGGFDVAATFPEMASAGHENTVLHPGSIAPQFIVGAEIVAGAELDRTTGRYTTPVTFLPNPHYQPMHRPAIIIADQLPASSVIDEQSRLQETEPDVFTELWAEAATILGNHFPDGPSATAQRDWARPWVLHALHTHGADIAEQVAARLKDRLSLAPPVTAEQVATQAQMAVRGTEPDPAERPHLLSPSETGSAAEHPLRSEATDVNVADLTPRMEPRASGSGLPRTHGGTRDTHPTDSPLDAPQTSSEATHNAPVPLPPAGLEYLRGTIKHKDLARLIRRGFPQGSVSLWERGLGAKPSGPDGVAYAAINAIFVDIRDLSDDRRYSTFLADALADLRVTDKMAEEGFRDKVIQVAVDAKLIATTAATALIAPIAPVPLPPTGRRELHGAISQQTIAKLIRPGFLQRDVSNWERGLGAKPSGPDGVAYAAINAILVQIQDLSDDPRYSTFLADALDDLRVTDKMAEEGFRDKVIQAAVDAKLIATTAPIPLPEAGLKNLRGGISQEALAALIRPGLSGASVSDWERGRVPKPSGPDGVAYAAINVLLVDIRDLSQDPRYSTFFADALADLRVTDKMAEEGFRNKVIQAAAADEPASGAGTPGPVADQEEGPSGADADVDAADPGPVTGWYPEETQSTRAPSEAAQDVPFVGDVAASVRRMTDTGLVSEQQVLTHIAGAEGRVLHVVRLSDTGEVTAYFNTGGAGQPTYLVHQQSPEGARWANATQDQALQLLGEAPLTPAEAETVARALRLPPDTANLLGSTPQDVRPAVPVLVHLLRHVLPYVVGERGTDLVEPVLHVASQQSWPAHVFQPGFTGFPGPRISAQVLADLATPEVVRAGVEAYLTGINLPSLRPEELVRALAAVVFDTADLTVRTRAAADTVTALRRLDWHVRAMDRPEPVTDEEFRTAVTDARHAVEAEPGPAAATNPITFAEINVLLARQDLPAATAESVARALAALGPRPAPELAAFIAGHGVPSSLSNASRDETRTPDHHPQAEDTPSAPHPSPQAPPPGFAEGFAGASEALRPGPEEQPSSDLSEVRVAVQALDNLWRRESDAAGAPLDRDRMAADVLHLGPGPVGAAQHMALLDLVADALRSGRNEVLDSLRQLALYQLEPLLGDDTVFRDANGRAGRNWGISGRPVGDGELATDAVLVGHPDQGNPQDVLAPAPWSRVGGTAYAVLLRRDGFGPLLHHAGTDYHLYDEELALLLARDEVLSQLPHGVHVVLAGSFVGAGELAIPRAVANAVGRPTWSYTSTVDRRAIPRTLATGAEVPRLHFAPHLGDRDAVPAGQWVRSDAGDSYLFPAVQGRNDPWVTQPIVTADGVAVGRASLAAGQWAQQERSYEQLPSLTEFFVVAGEDGPAVRSELLPWAVRGERPYFFSVHTAGNIAGMFGLGGDRHWFNRSSLPGVLRRRPSLSARPPQDPVVLMACNAEVLLPGEDPLTQLTFGGQLANYLGRRVYGANTSVGFRRGQYAPDGEPVPPFMILPNTDREPRWIERRPEPDQARLHQLMGTHGIPDEETALRLVRLLRHVYGAEVEDLAEPEYAYLMNASVALEQLRAGAAGFAGDLTTRAVHDFAQYMLSDGAALGQVPHELVRTVREIGVGTRPEPVPVPAPDPVPVAGHSALPTSQDFFLSAPQPPDQTAVASASTGEGDAVAFLDGLWRREFRRPLDLDLVAGAVLHLRPDTRVDASHRTALLDLVVEILHAGRAGELTSVRDLAMHHLEPLLKEDSVFHDAHGRPGRNWDVHDPATNLGELVTDEVRVPDPDPARIEIDVLARAPWVRAGGSAYPVLLRRDRFGPLLHHAGADYHLGDQELAHLLARDPLLAEQPDGVHVVLAGSGTGSGELVAPRAVANQVGRPTWSYTSALLRREAIGVDGAHLHFGAHHGDRTARPAGLWLRSDVGDRYLFPGTTRPSDRLISQPIVDGDGYTIGRASLPLSHWAWFEGSYQSLNSWRTHRVLNAAGNAVVRSGVPLPWAERGEQPYFFSAHGNNQMVRVRRIGGGELPLDRVSFGQVLRRRPSLSGRAPADPVVLLVCNAERPLPGEDPLTHLTVGGQLANDLGRRVYASNATVGLTHRTRSPGGDLRGPFLDLQSNIPDPRWIERRPEPDQARLRQLMEAHQIPDEETALRLVRLLRHVHGVDIEDQEAAHTALLTVYANLEALRTAHPQFAGRPLTTAAMHEYAVFLLAQDTSTAGSNDPVNVLLRELADGTRPAPVLPQADPGTAPAPAGLMSPRDTLSAPQESVRSQDEQPFPLSDDHLRATADDLTPHIHRGGPESLGEFVNLSSEGTSDGDAVGFTRLGPPTKDGVVGFALKAIGEHGRDLQLEAAAAKAELEQAAVEGPSALEALARRLAGETPPRSLEEEGLTDLYLTPDGLAELRARVREALSQDPLWEQVGARRQDAAVDLVSYEHWSHGLGAAANLAEQLRHEEVLRMSLPDPALLKAGLEAAYEVIEENYAGWSTLTLSETERHQKLMWIANDLHGSESDPDAAEDRAADWDLEHPGSLTTETFQVRVLDTAVPHAKVFSFLASDDLYNRHLSDRWAKHNPDGRGFMRHISQPDPHTGMQEHLGPKRHQWTGPTAYLEVHASPESFRPATHEHGSVWVPPEVITNLLQRMPEFKDFVISWRRRGFEPNIVITGCEAGEETLLATQAAQAVADALNSTKTYAAPYLISVLSRGELAVVTDDQDVPEEPFIQFSAASPGRKRVEVASPLFSGAISLDGPGNSRMRFPFVPDDTLKELIEDRTPGGRPFVV